ncbi:MAG: flagellar hook assembly protein FlgD [Proteobacteria bacterium]|nr:MAG: flagellar hook assembly protein FlgD [Pseudomonadota bacterium]
MVSVSQQVAPPTLQTSATHNFSDAKVDPQTAASAEDDPKKIDFRSLITNSMDDVKKKRAAKENGDLTSSSDAEFLDKLAEQSKEKRQPKNELGKDDFLKLFVTQLQNQDPMNPDDGTEMAAKLAQFNGLEQMMNVNKGIEKLIAAQTTDRNMGMMSYIGKEVTVDGGRIRLEEGKATPSEFSSEFPIASATLEIRDASGMMVNQLDLGAMDKGTHQIAWDGKTSEGRQMTEGVYTYNIAARNSDGEPVPVNLSSKAKINGVDIKSKDGALFSDFGKVTFDQIRSVGLIGFDKVATPEAAISKKPAALEVGQRLGSAVEAPEKPKISASTTDGLDKLQAEGKLDIKKPGAIAEAKSGDPIKSDKPKTATPHAGTGTGAGASVTVTPVPAAVPLPSQPNLDPTVAAAAASASAVPQAPSQPS